MGKEDSFKPNQDKMAENPHATPRLEFVVGLAWSWWNALWEGTRATKIETTKGHLTVEARKRSNNHTTVPTNVKTWVTSGLPQAMWSTIIGLVFPWCSWFQQWVARFFQIGPSYSNESKWLWNKWILLKPVCREHVCSIVSYSSLSYVQLGSYMVPCLPLSS